MCETCECWQLAFFRVEAQCKTKHLWKEGYSHHFEIRVCDALSQETEWCPAFLHLTLLSIETQDELQIKQSSPLPGTHLGLYCEQRSAAAGTERFEAEIILSAISYKYLTEKGGRGERKRQGRRTGRGGGVSKGTFWKPCDNCAVEISNKLKVRPGWGFAALFQSRNRLRCTL